MIMGPVAAISCLFCCYQLHYPQKSWVKVLYFVTLLGGLLCVLQAGSRAAFFAAFVSIVVFLYVVNRKRKIKLIGRLVAVLVVLAITSPLWMPYTDKLTEKNGSTTEMDIGSREGYWNQRIREFESSPIIGIGFQTVEIGAEGSIVREENGGVETGTSWLAVLSMTGILGFLCFLYIYIKAIVIGLNLSKKRPVLGGYLVSICVFFGLHMLAEGYVFAAGNAMCCILWLIFGSIFGIEAYPQFSEEIEQRLSFRV